MKLFLIALTLLSATSSFADEPCYKPGDKVKLYGAIDTFHFFHAGNGMHVKSLTVRANRAFCVEPGFAEGSKFNTFQLLSEDSRLKDGTLVDLEGTYSTFGDTAWYSSYPLLSDVKVTKIHKRDPNEVR